jgi:hypothetical protein
MTAETEAQFRALGFNKRLSTALAIDGFDPKRLLTADRRRLTLIPNVGKKGLAEIEAYRARDAQPPKPPS